MFDDYNDEPEGYGSDFDSEEPEFTCPALGILVRSYMDDPMSENAPGECLTLIINQHKRNCSTCKSRAYI